MARLYGGRWQTVDRTPIGAGAQAYIFRVKDMSGEHQGEFALKRIPDAMPPFRHPGGIKALRSEIGAIRRLTDPVTGLAHPNIIPLIDHSALNKEANPDAHFLVMPIANGGDLDVPDRISSYKDSIDNALPVIKQVAVALSAVHVANIIHRDVKPANILFYGNKHAIWLSDFGHCLFCEVPRLTETQKVFGSPFMAPEVADGGQFDVTPSADIYSLGKVIYFMLSGGIILPRERDHKDPFPRVSAKGEQYDMLDMLLRKMICSVEHRIQSVEQVIKELEKIEASSEILRVGAVI